MFLNVAYVFWWAPFRSFGPENPLKNQITIIPVSFGATISNLGHTLSIYSLCVIWNAYLKGGREHDQKIP